MCVCVLAVYNKAQAQRISNREFKLWTFLQGTESRVATVLAESCIMSHQSLCACVCVCVCVCPIGKWVPDADIVCSVKTIMVDPFRWNGYLFTFSIHDIRVQHHNAKPKKSRSATALSIIELHNIKRRLYYSHVNDKPSIETTHYWLVNGKIDLLNTVIIAKSSTLIHCMSIFQHNTIH